MRGGQANVLKGHGESGLITVMACMHPCVLTAVSWKCNGKCLNNMYMAV